MQYELSLIEADFRDASAGAMRLGLNHGSRRVAELDYEWDAAAFRAVFHGNAADLPVPGHPTAFLHQALSEIRSHQTEDTPRPTDVFCARKVFLTLES